MFGVNTFRIIGFDPSVDNMGVGILEVDIRTYKVICAQSFTLKGKDHVKRYAHIAKIHGDRVAKLHGHYNAILNIFDQWDPHCSSRVLAPLLHSNGRVEYVPMR